MLNDDDYARLAGQVPAEPATPAQPPLPASSAAPTKNPAPHKAAPLPGAQLVDLVVGTARKAQVDPALLYGVARDIGVDPKDPRSGLETLAAQLATAMSSAGNTHKGLMLLYGGDDPVTPDNLTVKREAAERTLKIATGADVSAFRLAARKYSERAPQYQSAAKEYFDSVLGATDQKEAERIAAEQGQKLLKKYNFSGDDVYLLNKFVRREYQGFRNKVNSDAAAANLPREVASLANRYPAPKPKTTGADVLKAGGLSLLQSAISLPQMAVGAYDLLVNTPINAGLRAAGSSRRLSAAKALADMGYRPEEAKQILQDMKPESIKAGADAVNAASGVADTAGAYLENPAVAVDDAVQSVFPSLAGAGAGRVAAAAVLAKNPAALVVAERAALTAGAAAEGVQSAGDMAYRQSLRQGEITPIQAAADTAAGFGVGLVGRYAGKVTGLGDADTDLAMSGLNKAAKQVLPAKEYAKAGAKTLAKSVAQEAGVEEPTQSVLEQAMDNLAEGRDVSAGLGKAAVRGAVTAMPMGALAGARKHVSENKLGNPPAAQPESTAAAEVEAALAELRNQKAAAASDVAALNKNQVPALPEPAEVAAAKQLPDFSKVSDDQLKYLATQHPDPAVRAEVLNVWEARKLSPENFTLGDKFETATEDTNATEPSQTGKETQAPGAAESSTQPDLLDPANYPATGGVEQKDAFAGWQPAVAQTVDQPTAEPVVERNPNQGELDIGTRRKAEWQKPTAQQPETLQQVETVLPPDLEENRRIAGERDRIMALSAKEALVELGVPPSAQTAVLRRAQAAGLKTGRDIVSAFTGNSGELSQAAIQSAPGRWAAQFGAAVDNKLVEWSYLDNQQSQSKVATLPAEARPRPAVTPTQQPEQKIRKAPNAPGVYQIVTPKAQKTTKPNPAGMWDGLVPTDAKLSVDETDQMAHQTRAADIEHALRSHALLGPVLGKLLDAGKINIAQAMEGNPKAAGSDADGRINLYTSKLPLGKAVPVAVHEAVHTALRQYLGDAATDRLFSKLTDMEKAARNGTGEVSQFFKDAAKHLPANTPDEHRGEELGAYAVQKVMEGKAPKGIVAWVKNLVAQVRAALFKATNGRLGKIDERMLHRLTIQALKGWADKAAVAQQEAKGEMQIKSAKVTNPDIGIGNIPVDSFLTAKTAKELLDTYIGMGKDAPLVALASELAKSPVLNGVAVRFLKQGDTPHPQVARAFNTGTAALASFSPDGEVELIFRSDRQLREDLVVHETIHALTEAALARNPALHSSLSKLATEIGYALSAQAGFSKDAKKDGLRNFWKTAVNNNPGELLAYGLTSPTFRDVFSEYAADGRPFSEYRTPDQVDKLRVRESAPSAVTSKSPAELTLWQKTVDWFMSAIGLPPKNKVAFESALAAHLDAVKRYNAEDAEYRQMTPLTKALGDALRSLLQDTNDNGAGYSAQAAGQRGENLPRVETDTGTAGTDENPVKYSEAQDSPNLDEQYRNTNVTAAGAMDKIAELWGDKKVWAQVQTLRQFTASNSKHLPSLKTWTNVLFRRQAAANELLNNANEVMAEVNSLGREDALALLQLMQEESFNEVFADRDAPSTANEKQRLTHMRLAARYAKFSDAQKAAYNKVRAAMTSQWDHIHDALRKLVVATIHDPVKQAEALREIESRYRASRELPYFPLQRHGKYFVIGKDVDGEGTNLLMSYDTRAEAERALDVLVAQGVRGSKVVMRPDPDTFDRDALPDSGFLHSLHNAIDTNVADPAEQQDLHLALQKLYLEALPQFSGAKKLLGRSATKVIGFDNDARRALAVALSSGARYASQLEYAPKLNALMQDMEAEAKGHVTPHVFVHLDGTPSVEVFTKAHDVHTAAEAYTSKPEQFAVFNAGHNDLATAIPEHLKALRTLAEEASTSKSEGKADRAKKLLAVLTDDNIARITDEAVSEAQKAADTAPTTSTNRIPAQQVLNEVKRRAKDLHGVPQTLGRRMVGGLLTWSYINYLAGNVSTAVNNTMQTPIITLPYMAAKLGPLAATKLVKYGRLTGKVVMPRLLSEIGTLGQASPLVINRVKGLTDGQRKMLIETQNGGLLDYTVAADLAAVANNTSEAADRALRLGGAMNHWAEVWNRMTTALAAYEGHMEKFGEGHDAAVAYVQEVLWKTHGDNSQLNTAPFMKANRHPALLLMTQFQKYPLAMWEMLSGLVKQAFTSKQDRAFAFKALAGMYSIAWVAAGPLAMPFASTFAFIIQGAANAAKGEDDDEFEFRSWWTNTVKDKGWPTWLENAVLGGVSRSLFGAENAARVGTGDIIPVAKLGQRIPKARESAGDAFLRFMADHLGGAPLATVEQVWKGGAQMVDDFNDPMVHGWDNMRGLMAAAPAVIRNVEKANRIWRKGVENPSHAAVLKPEDFTGWEVANQALGFQPAKVADYYNEVRNVLLDAKKTNERMTELAKELADAYVRGDTAAIERAQVAIEKFHEANPYAPSVQAKARNLIAGPEKAQAWQDTVGASSAAQYRQQLNSRHHDGR